jgi:hypothetical protein
LSKQVKKRRPKVRVPVPKKPPKVEKSKKTYKREEEKKELRKIIEGK